MADSVSKFTIKVVPDTAQMKKVIEQVGKKGMKLNVDPVFPSTANPETAKTLADLMIGTHERQRLLEAAQSKVAAFEQNHPGKKKTWSAEDQAEYRKLTKSAGGYKSGYTKANNILTTYQEQLVTPETQATEATKQALLKAKEEGKPAQEVEQLREAWKAAGDKENQARIDFIKNLRKAILDQTEDKYWKTADFSSLAWGKTRKKSRMQEIMDDTLYGDVTSKKGFDNKATELLSYLDSIYESLSKEDQDVVQSAQKVLNKFRKDFAEGKNVSATKTADKLRGLGLYNIGERSKGRGKEQWEERAESYLQAFRDNPSLKTKTVGKNFLESVNAMREAYGVVAEEGEDATAEQREALRQAQEAVQKQLRAVDQMLKDYATTTKAKANAQAEAIEQSEDKAEEATEDAGKAAKEAAEGAIKATEKAAEDAAKATEKSQKTEQTALPVPEAITATAPATAAAAEQAAGQVAAENQQVAQSATSAAQAEQALQETVSNTTPMEQGTNAAEQLAQANEHVVETVNAQAEAAKKVQGSNDNGSGSGSGGGNPPSNGGDDDDDSAGDNLADKLNQMMDNAKADVLKAVEKANALVDSLKRVRENDSDLNGMVSDLQRRATGAEASIENSALDGDALTSDTVAGFISDYNRLVELMKQIQVRAKEVAKIDKAQTDIHAQIEKAKTNVSNLQGVNTSPATNAANGYLAEIEQAEAALEQISMESDPESKLQALNVVLKSIADTAKKAGDAFKQFKQQAAEAAKAAADEAKATADAQKKAATQTKQTAQYNKQRFELTNNLREGLSTFQSNLDKLGKFGVDTSAIHSQAQGVLSSDLVGRLMDDNTDATREKVETLAAAWEVVKKAVQETTASIKQQEAVTAAVGKAQSDIHAQIEKATTNASNLKGLNTPSATIAADTYSAKIKLVRSSLEQISTWKNPEKKLQALNLALKIITNTTKKAGEAFQQFKQQETDATKASNQLARATTAAHKNLATIQDMRTRWTAMTKSQRDELNAIETSLTEGLASNDLEKLKAANQALVLFRSNIKAAGKDTRSFFDVSKALATKLSSFFGMGQIISSVINRLKQAVVEVEKIDTSMVNLKKVTTETASAYKAYQQEAAQRAIELSTSMTDYIDATTGFARMGENMEDAQTLGELAVIYKNVGDEINSVDDATNTLISTMKAFNMTTAEAGQIVDEFNYVGNNYAITSGDIGEILKRSAAAMSAANTSMEETIALGTAAQTIVQDEEKVGGALSTLSMRIRGSTSELESAGEEVDDYASSTSKLRDEIQALTKVDIMKNSTEYKSMYQILGEISKEWTNLTDVSRANVAEILFGKMRANVGMSILSNFDIAEDVLSKLTNGTADNSAAKEYNTYLDSVAAKQAKLEASFQAFSQSLISSDLVKFNYDAGSGILGLLTKALDLFGSVPTVVGLAAVALKKFIPETGISIMPQRERNSRWQKSVYAGNMMQGGLATTWSEKTGVNAQRKHLGRGNKKIDQQAYGESLRANRFLLYSAHHGSAGDSCVCSCTLTDCKGLAA